MRIVRALSSPKLAAVLIGALLALCLVNFLIPQQPMAELMLYAQWAKANPSLAKIARVTQLDDVFASPLFIGLLVLLALNLSVCTVRRMTRRPSGTPRVPTSPPSSAEIFEVSEPPGALQSRLAGRWRSWKMTSARDGARQVIVLDRHERARLGSLVMHLGLLLLIAGGVVSALTRFTGTLTLTEGESLPDKRSSYTSVAHEPKLGSGYTGAVLTLESLRFDYDRGFITQAHAKLGISDGSESRTLEAAVNRPAKWDGKYYVLQRGGHAVGLSVGDPSGALVPESVVRLGTAMSAGSADTLALPDGRRLEIVTVADRSNKDLSQERFKLTDPAVRFRIDKQEPGIWLRPGGSGQLEDLTISVNDVRLWNEFSARKDAGIPLVYLAFAVVTAGATIRFGFGKKRLGLLLVPTEVGTQIAVWGSDESSLARLVSDLRSTRDSETGA